MRHILMYHHPQSPIPKSLAQSSLTAANALALTEEERATVADEVAYVAELVDQH
jgi:hypothetical protein